MWNTCRGDTFTQLIWFSDRTISMYAENIWTELTCRSIRDPTVATDVINNVVYGSWDRCRAHAASLSTVDVPSNTTRALRHLRRHPWRVIAPWLTARWRWLRSHSVRVFCVASSRRSRCAGRRRRRRRWRCSIREFQHCRDCDSTIYVCYVYDDAVKRRSHYMMLLRRLYCVSISVSDERFYRRYVLK